MTRRPWFVCEGCGGTVIAAVRLVDIETVALRHAATCPGEAKLRPHDINDPGRRRWGEERAAAYAQRLEAAKLARRMPQRRPPRHHPSQQRWEL